MNPQSVSAGATVVVRGSSSKRHIEDDRETNVLYKQSSTVEVGIIDNIRLGSVDEMIGEASSIHQLFHDRENRQRPREGAGSQDEVNISFEYIPTTSGRGTLTEKALSLNTPRKLRLAEQVARKTEELGEKDKIILDLQREKNSTEFYLQRCRELLSPELARIVEASIRNKDAAKQGVRFDKRVKVNRNHAVLFITCSIQIFKGEYLYITLHNHPKISNSRVAFVPREYGF